MADRFDGVRRKIDRAKEHIADLEAAIGTLSLDRPYAVAIKDHGEPGKLVAYVSHMEPWLPDRLQRLSLIAGEATHSMRTALDYFACDVVPLVTDETAFPVWRKSRVPSTQDLIGLMGRKVQGAPQALVDALCALEPYQRAKGHQIWLLDHLDAIDKHRLLVAVAVVTRSVVFDFAETFRSMGILSGPVPSMPLEINMADRDILNVGVELLSGPADFFATQQELQFPCDVVFDEPNSIGRDLIALTLRHLVDEVEALLQKLMPLA